MEPDIGQDSTISIETSLLSAESFEKPPERIMSIEKIKEIVIPRGILNGLSVQVADGDESIVTCNGRGGR